MPDSTLLRVVAERIEQPVLLGNADGRVAWINPAYARLAGANAAKLIGSPIPGHSNANGGSPPRVPHPADRPSAGQPDERHQLDAVSALASGVAHEINNALTPVLLSIDILQEEAPHMQELLHNMAEGANRAATMVQVLLEYARALKADPTTPRDRRDRVEP